MYHMCPRLYIHWVHTFFVQESEIPGKPRIQYYLEKHAPSLWQVMPPVCRIEYTELSNECILDFSKCGDTEDRVFCKMVPLNLRLVRMSSCPTERSVLTALLWGPKILFTEATAVNSMQPPVSWRFAVFPCHYSFLYPTVAASTSTEDETCSEAVYAVEHFAKRT